MASTSRILAKNLFPRPSPCAAPLTSPAISTNSTRVGRIFSDLESSAKTFKNDLNYNYKDYSSGFNCKNINNLISELFYITANALSTQSIFSISNYSLLIIVIYDK